MAQKSRAYIRKGVHSRIRKKVSGTSDRPRLAVFRSINHIYAQVIDDVSGKTLASAATTEKALKVKSGGNVDGAKEIGKAIAERAISAGVSTVVYDRGGYVYHGRVKALLDATREAGLNKTEEEAKPKKKAAKSEKKKETKKETKKKPEKKPEKKAKAENKKDNSAAEDKKGWKRRRVKVLSKETIKKDNGNE